MMGTFFARSGYPNLKAAKSVAGPVPKIENSTPFLARSTMKSNPALGNDSFMFSIGRDAPLRQGTSLL